MKKYIKERINLLKISIINTFQNETAYNAETWSSLLSTTFYTISYIIFVDVIFSNTKLVAGYDHNQMLFFFFVTQISAYLFFAIIMSNIDQLIEDVNNGGLDLILTKPIPSLFFILTRKIKTLTILRDGFPPMLIVTILINWHDLNLSFSGILFGILLFIFGFICVYSILLIFALPAFWIGESSNIYGLAIEFFLGADSTIPFEGYGKQFKFAVLIFIPSIFMGGVSTSVMLGKSSPLMMIVFAAIITFIVFLVMNFLWNLALRNYTSASS